MNTARIKIELINSEAGRCIAINDYRVAGPKPIHGVVVSEWSTDQNDILRAFLTPDQKHEWLSEELHVAPLSGSERYLKSELVHELKVNAGLVEALRSMLVEAEFVGEAKAPFSTFVAEKCRKALKDAGAGEG